MARPSEWFRGKPPWTLPMIVFGALVAVVFIGVILSLTFAGCAAQPGVPQTPAQNDSVSGLTEKHFVLRDGRDVTCITWAEWDYVNEAMKSGMDCLEPAPE